MKIQIASDLHLEFLDQRFPDFRVIEHTEADVLVIAGDIHRNTKAITAFADWPVLAHSDTRMSTYFRQLN